MYLLFVYGVYTDKNKTTNDEEKSHHKPTFP